MQHTSSPQTTTSCTYLPERYSARDVLTRYQGTPDRELRVASPEKLRRRIEEVLAGGQPADAAPQIYKSFRQTGSKGVQQHSTMPQELALAWLLYDCDRFAALTDEPGNHYRSSVFRNVLRMIDDFWIKPRSSELGLDKRELAQLFRERLSALPFVSKAACIPVLFPKQHLAEDEFYPVAIEDIAQSVDFTDTAMAAAVDSLENPVFRARKGNIDFEFAFDVVEDLVDISVLNFAVQRALREFPHLRTTSLSPLEQRTQYQLGQCIHEVLIENGMENESSLCEDASRLHEQYRVVQFFSSLSRLRMRGSCDDAMRVPPEEIVCYTDPETHEDWSLDALSCVVRELSATAFYRENAAFLDEKWNVEALRLTSILDTTLYRDAEERATRFLQTILQLEHAGSGEISGTRISLEQETLKEEQCALQRIARLRAGDERFPNYMRVIEQSIEAVVSAQQEREKRLKLYSERVREMCANYCDTFMSLIVVERPTQSQIVTS